MRKSADVVILMQLNSKIQVCYPKEINWDNWRKVSTEIPFSDKVIDYLNALSGRLLKDKRSRAYSDVVTFAFYCRKANLLQLKEKFMPKDLSLGRGVVFHIAPSNVPINFAYSLISGLLSGNHNIVRVSSKDFAQVDLVIEQMLDLFTDPETQEVAERIALIKYDRENKEATDFFSSFCHTRIIWGGDNTIANIRQSALAPRSFDISFADRYSFAVIKANEIIKDKDKIEQIAEGFYNDTYLFDQNACSAPHLVVWLGEKQQVIDAKKIFWEQLQKILNIKYPTQAVLSIDKLTAMYKQAVAMPIKKENAINNNLQRIELLELSEKIDEYRCAGGYFNEYHATKGLSEIVPIVKNNYQTMAYYGLDKAQLQDFVLSNDLIGIDRIVPIGKTLDFSLTWDGYNLIEKLTRKIEII